MTEAEQRREYSQQRASELLRQLEKAGVSEFQHTAICMTGSYGRLEASARSDLDVVLLSEDQDPDPSNSEHKNIHTRILKARIGSLDETRLKSRLIEGMRSIGLKDVDSDGRYLVNYTPSKLIGMIGRVADDSDNTFTSRMLLLLEGRALTNCDILSRSRKAIISSYWRDYKGPPTLFAPAFMSNDILRMWRTFCVNYEARTASIPQNEINRRRLKNYKLKYSRMLTCYSAILSMLDVFGRSETLTPAEMEAICDLTPHDRIIELLRNANSTKTRDAIGGILTGYEEYLTKMQDSEEALLAMFSDTAQLRKMLEASYGFAHSIFDSINAIGAGSKLHRMVVV